MNPESWIKSSRIDCSSILYGTSYQILNKLKYIQNFASVPAITSRLSSETYHWLPDPKQTQYKVCLLTHRSLHNPGAQAPSASPHCSTTTTNIPSCSLYSSHASLLSLPFRTLYQPWATEPYPYLPPPSGDCLTSKHIRDFTDQFVFKSLANTHPSKTATV